MMEKRNQETKSFLRVKMKPDLSEEDLERVVDDFERQYNSQNNTNVGDEGNFNPQDDRE
jgi:dihydroorotate dehydrogenase